jgi:hypothetical protein
MRNRRVLLCLPETPSEDVLAVARVVKAALSANYQVLLKLANEDFDDDVTPVDTPLKQPLVVSIKEPSDDGERPM